MAKEEQTVIIAASLAAVVVGGIIATYFIITSAAQNVFGLEVWDETTGDDVSVGQIGSGSRSITLNVGDTVADKQPAGTSVPAGSVVSLYWNDAVIDTAVANAQGYWEVDTPLGGVEASLAGTQNTAYVVVTPPGGTPVQSDVIVITVNPI